NKTISTSPSFLPSFHLAYVKSSCYRCIHCERMAVSTMFPISWSVSLIGENKAVRSDGLVRYTLKLVILFNLFALIRTLFNTLIKKADSKYSQYFFNVSF